MELDELWSYVDCKGNQQWIWAVLCRRTRQIVSYYIGPRTDEMCRACWKLVLTTYKKCVSYADFWESYEKVIDSGKHQSIGKESGETAHIERWYNTLRQRVGRFVRKTLSFSKSEEMHELHFKLFVHDYNLPLKK